MSGPSRVLVADPAWRFDDELGDRGAEANYRCMTTRAICAMPLPPLLPDCVLFLWRVAVLQRAALDVVDAWGFTLKTEVVWLKKTRYGRRWFGLGHVTRAEHEVCLVATRGRPEVLDHALRSTFVTDLDVDGISAEAGQHSAKPERFYGLVESLFSGPYCEMFARRQRPGWTCIGDEL